MSYGRFARGNRRDYERYAHERDDPESARPKSGGNGLDARPYSRDARRTMESHTSLRTDEPNAGYRYQYEYEQASYMEIYSHRSAQATAPVAGQPVPDWRLHPLSLTVGAEVAHQFHWKAETGTVYTYEHGLTCRYIHLDRITRQFCDQQRNPLSADRALAHAMPHPDEVAASQAVVHEAQSAVQPLPSPVLPAPSFTGQPFDGQSLVGQWKAASAVRERSELSVGSFVRRADFEAQESHDRFTASAVRFLQHELPPGTGALVRIYRKLTMKASQVHHAAEVPMSRLEAQPAQAQHVYAESAQPLTRTVQPVQHAGELNVAAFTRRAA